MINNNLDYEKNSNTTTAGGHSTAARTMQNHNNSNSNSVDNNYFNRFDNRIAANLAAVLTGTRFRSSSTSGKTAATSRANANANSISNSTSNVNAFTKAPAAVTNGLSNCNGVAMLSRGRHAQPPTHLQLNNGGSRPSSPALSYCSSSGGGGGGGGGGGSMGRNRRKLYLLAQTNLK